MEKKSSMKKYAIDNLDCPNCAANLETSLNKLDYVDNAKIIFATKSLYIDTKDINKVRREVSLIEPDVIISELDEANNFQEKNEYNVKREIFTVSSYIIAFFAAILWIDIYPEKPLVYAGYVLLFLIYFAAGKDVITSAFRNLGKGMVFDENFLMTFATVAAFFIGAYTESVAVMIFYRTGEFFQDWAVNKSRRSIKSLIEIRPDYANVDVDGKIVKVNPESVSIGEIVTVNPSEKVSLDGIIVKGETTLDCRALTGESIPKSVKIGDEVLAGTISLTGVIDVKVTKPFKESSVSKILDLVENAAANKAKTENFITTFAKYYTPMVFLVAIIVSVLPVLLGFGTFKEWIYRGLIVLVVSCPCALLISVPLGYFGGIGLASRKGILVKGANYLEALANVKAIALDKTGTLTKGVFKVTNIYPFNDFTKEEVLKYAAMAESRSNHPIAKSICQEVGNIEDFNINHYEEIHGHGVKVTIDGRILMVGSDKLLHKFNINHSQNVCSLADGVAHVVIDNVYAGYIVISDELKDDAKSAIEELEKLGIKNIAILTGDSKFSAEKIAGIAGIKEYYSDLLPEDKSEIFKEFSSKSNKGKYGKTMYAGDGINDAPVLALADVGVSMGRLGSDAAIETADVVIMDDSLMKLPESIKVAKRTKTIIWQNIIFALGIKLLFVILGLFGVATIWEAVFGDVGVALLALLNSVRILKG